MRLLVCGGREWSSISKIRTILKTIEPEVVIHGDCRGADRLAGQVAREMGIVEEKYPAKWKEYGKAAGVIRNQQMLDEGKPDMVIAFHSDISDSRGTADMLRRAENAGLPTKLYS